MSLFQKTAEPTMTASVQSLPAGAVYQPAPAEPGVVMAASPTAPAVPGRSRLHPLVAVMAASITLVSAIGAWALWRQATTPAPAPPPVALCQQCGVVESVSSYEVRGEGSGLGAVAGAGAGGALGNQMGKGNGKTALTVLGAVGGALAGHEAEKKIRSHRVWAIKLRMEDGSERRINQNWAPAWRTGDPVRVVDGKVVSREFQPAAR